MHVHNLRVKIKYNLRDKAKATEDEWFSSILYVLIDESGSNEPFLSAPAQVRAGKSSKMSESGLLLGVKCPQSSVEEILQNRQFYLSIPHFQPQIKLLSPISTLKWGYYSSSLNIHIKINEITTQICNHNICVWFLKTKTSSILKKISARTAAAACPGVQYLSSVALHHPSSHLCSSPCQQSVWPHILQFTNKKGFNVEWTFGIPINSLGFIVIHSIVL
jgi:hypothetical protein